MNPAGRAACALLLVLIVLPMAAAARPPGPEYVRFGTTWARHELTWGIQEPTGDLTLDQQSNAIRRALDTWSEAADLTFTEVLDCDRSPVGCEVPHIRIAFYTPATHRLVDDAHQESSQGHAFYPPSADRQGLDGDVHLRDDVTWRVGGGFPDLEAIALHELGHALGLSHPDAPSTGSSGDPGTPGSCPSTPSASRPTMCALTLGLDHDLAPDDVRGIRALYGRPAHAVDGTIRRDVDRAARGDDLVNTTGRGQAATYARARGQRARFLVRFWNEGTQPDTLTFRATAGRPGFTVRYLAVTGPTTTDVTNPLSAGTYEVRLPPGGSRLLRVEVTVGPDAVRHRARGFDVRATSGADPTLADVTRAIVEVT